MLNINFGIDGIGHNFFFLGFPKFLLSILINITDAINIEEYVPAITMWSCQIFNM